MFRMILLASLLCSPLLLSPLVHAATDDIRLYRDGDQVDPQEVARILGRDNANEAAPATTPQVIRTRSIRMLDEPPATAPVSAASSTYRPAASLPAARASQVASAGTTSDALVSPQANALALPVQFAFDSAEILPKARAQLDALAQGVRMLAPDRQVTIEGHTDAQGSEQYNLELSRRRALSVKNYLVVTHGIQESRLKAIGMGEYQPYNNLDPNSAENRRVQFRGS